MHRVEVFTGNGCRRRWPAEAKAAIVEESYASDDPVSVVARRHGLIPQQLFTWRRQAREGIGGREAAEMSFAEVIAGIQHLRPPTGKVLSTSETPAAPSGTAALASISSR